jgi:predicted membrane channel-forming protein YqfA (hemolysin III family)
VATLLGMRFIYLRILHKYHLFPELFYIPRGLITILLFYKIPEFRKLQGFDEGILFFVILATALILMLGSLLYKDKPTEYESGSDIDV